MMWIKMIPAKIWGWIAVALLLLCLGFTVNYAWKLRAENSSLESSVQILERSVEKTKETNQVKFDSLQKVISAQELDLENIQGQLPGILQKIETINKKQDEKKLDILRTTSVDSLAGFFTKRYYRHH